MANIIEKIISNVIPAKGRYVEYSGQNFSLLKVDAPPSSGEGTWSPPGTIGIWDDEGWARFYFKYGWGDKDWLLIIDGGEGISSEAGGNEYIQKDIFQSEQFSYSLMNNISVKTLTQTPKNDIYSTNMRELLRNGVVVELMTVDVPAAPGEWRIYNGILEIYGNVTGDGDTYLIKYPSNQ